jgi:23S rRNA pseudouridine2457 synthase
MILLFNKPYGVVTRFTQENSTQPTLAGFHFPKNVYPIGRLDADSEGLLLLSDEKEWNDLLLHPRNEQERTYHVQVDGEATLQAVEKLSRGVFIQGRKTKPCKAALLKNPGYPERNPPIRFRKTVPTSWIELKLIEGKNRQVRHMTAAVGFPTLRLIRVSHGNLALGDLEPGIWRELNLEERKLLRGLI